MMEDWVCWEEKTIELLSKFAQEDCIMQDFYLSQLDEVKKEWCMAKEISMAIEVSKYSLVGSERIIEKYNKRGG